MIDVNNFSLFIAASVLLNIIPGPDHLYIVSRTIAQGRRAGFMSSWGVCTGALVHAVVAAFGLSTILATSAYAFALVKYAGVVYLIYLGIKTFFDKSLPVDTPNPSRAAASNWTLFGQGVLTDVLNPKVAIFFLAFLPQFVSPASDSRALSFIFLGVIVVLIAVVWEFFIVMSSAFVTRLLRQQPSVNHHLNQMTGLILVGLGIKLALERVE